MAALSEKKELISGPLRTPRQVARRLSLSESTIIRLYDSGDLAGVDVTPKDRKKRILRFRDDDVDRFEERRSRR